MRLQIGDEFRDPSPAQARGSAGDRPAYRVTGVVCETPWHGLYEGKKLFTNYHFGKRALEEAPEQEGLDVFLQTVHYTALDDREHIKDMREQAFFELRRVLGRTRGRSQPLSNLLPEPIDYLQVPNDRDAFAVPNPRQLTLYEPILVFERVHGLPLDRWLIQENPALVRRLEVLAELLDFMAVMHGEGLLLAGLGPGAVWVDGDRLHYMGANLVLDVARQKKQRKLYPPERCPRGFSAPERLDAEPDLGPGTDLYGWAALGYFLIVGETPAAGEAFADEHFARLQRELLQLPAGRLAQVQRAFHIGGSRLAHTWPDSFVGVLRECLLPQRALRPASREALAGLWAAGRPRAVPAALAVHTGRQVELLLATRELEPGLEMVIRRAAGFVPRHAQDGQLIAEGPLAVRAFDRNPLPARASRTPAPQPHYAVFTRARTDGEPAYSAAEVATLLDLSSPAGLRTFAEELAAGDTTAVSLEGRPALPQRAALLEELGDVVPVARAWLGSDRPLVRRWALHLLEGQLRTPVSREPARALLLDRCANDERPDLRRAALRALFQNERRPEPALVVRAALALGQGDVDAGIAAARALTGVGLDDEAVRAAVAGLEQERRSPCPECQAPVRAADLAEHLKKQHGHVEIDGRLLPYGEALRALWLGMMEQQQEQAAVRLAELFGQRHDERAVSAYSTALLAQVQQHAAALGEPGTEAAPGPAWERLGRCLAAHELTQRVSRELLTHPDAGWRRLARLALVGLVAGRLTGKGSTEQVRSALEGLCQRENLETRLAVLARLQAAGASPRAVRAVMQELEQDRETPCPHCGAVVRKRDEAEHLRSAHGIYEVAGERLPWEQALERISASLFTPDAGPERAGLFARIASDRLDEEGVATYLENAVVGERQRRGAVPPLTVVAGLPQSSAVVTRLLSGQPELALALFAASGKQASLTLLERVAPWLGRTELTEELRRRALEEILKNKNSEKGTHERALEHFLSGTANPLEVLRLLDEVEQTVGRNTLFEARRRKACEAEVRCPACETTARLALLEEHAWQVHRLVVAGGAWRPAWEAIESCLREYQTGPEDRLIARAVDLAARDDAKTGPQRLGKLARRLGVKHALLPRRRWLDEQQRAQLRTLAWVAAALLTLVGLLAWLWR